MIIKLTLNPAQAESLNPVLDRQRDRKAGAILGVVDRVHDHATGKTAVVLSVTFIPRQTASKIINPIDKTSLSHS